MMGSVVMPGITGGSNHRGLGRRWCQRETALMAIPPLRAVVALSALFAILMFLPATASVASELCTTTTTVASTTTTTAVCSTTTTVATTTTTVARTITTTVVQKARKIPTGLAQTGGGGAAGSTDSGPMVVLGGLGIFAGLAAMGLALRRRRA